MVPRGGTCTLGCVITNSPAGAGVGGGGSRPAGGQASPAGTLRGWPSPVLGSASSSVVQAGSTVPLLHSGRAPRGGSPLPAPRRRHRTQGGVQREPGHAVAGGDHHVGHGAWGWGGVGGGEAREGAGVTASVHSSASLLQALKQHHVCGYSHGSQAGPGWTAWKPALLAAGACSLKQRSPYMQ